MARRAHVTRPAPFVSSSTVSRGPSAHEIAAPGATSGRPASRIVSAPPSWRSTRATMPTTVGARGAQRLHRLEARAAGGDRRLRAARRACRGRAPCRPRPAWRCRGPFAPCARRARAGRDRAGGSRGRRRSRADSRRAPRRRPRRTPAESASAWNISSPTSAWPSAVSTVCLQSMKKSLSRPDARITRFFSKLRSRRSSIEPLRAWPIDHERLVFFLPRRLLAERRHHGRRRTQSASTGPRVAGAALSAASGAGAGVGAGGDCVIGFGCGRDAGLSLGAANSDALAARAGRARRARGAAPVGSPSVRTLPRTSAPSAMPMRGAVRCRRRRGRRARASRLPCRANRLRPGPQPDLAPRTLPLTSPCFADARSVTVDISRLPSTRPRISTTPSPRRLPRTTVPGPMMEAPPSSLAHTSMSTLPLNEAPSAMVKPRRLDVADEATAGLHVDPLLGGHIARHLASRR